MCLLVEEIRINPDQSFNIVYQQRCERKQVINLINYLPFIIPISCRHYVHIKLGVSCLGYCYYFKGGVETVIIEKQMLLFTQLCKAVHANNILETNETTTETAPSTTTTTTTTTTAVPSTTRPTLVEFTPPVMKRLLRSRRSHNLIQLKAECCQGDLCNAFNLHDPNRKNMFFHHIFCCYNESWLNV